MTQLREKWGYAEFWDEVRAERLPDLVNSLLDCADMTTRREVGEKAAVARDVDEMTVIQW